MNKDVFLVKIRDFPYSVKRVRLLLAMLSKKDLDTIIDILKMNQYQRRVCNKLVSVLYCGYTNFMNVNGKTLNEMPKTEVLISSIYVTSARKTHPRPYFRAKGRVDSKINKNSNLYIEMRLK